MRSSVLLSACLLSMCACSRPDTLAPGSQADGGTAPHAPAASVSAAAPLHLDARALRALDAARGLGPYTLIRDQAAMARIWPAAGGPPPTVDFRTTSILARRVNAGVSNDSAAPRIIVKQGRTTVLLRRGDGPSTGTTDGRIELFAIPVTGAPVRTVAYEPAATPAH